jgi:hypothetical protein
MDFQPFFNSAPFLDMLHFDYTINILIYHSVVNFVWGRHILAIKLIMLHNSFWGQVSSVCICTSNYPLKSIYLTLAPYVAC